MLNSRCFCCCGDTPPFCGHVANCPRPKLVHNYNYMYMFSCLENYQIGRFQNRVFLGFQKSQIIQKYIKLWPLEKSMTYACTIIYRVS